VSAVLVTGASGYLGSRLLRKLDGAGYDALGLSRAPVDDGLRSVRGDFTSFEDLRALDQLELDVVVHLASEIGGCSEEAGIAVNVLGTRALMRYALDRGCRRFVLASSIAVVGCLSEPFLPRELPISDDHPCDATDAYGLSKGLMEELAFYFGRQNPDSEITIFRVGAVLKEDFRPDGGKLMTETHLPFVIGGGPIAVADALDAFAAAVEPRLGPGVRRMNLVGEHARTPIPVHEALRAFLGDRASWLDMSYYEAGGREFASLYTTERLRETLGFVPRINVRTLAESDERAEAAVAS
jgi:nucleoside-diphosphate-sugar epimerase